MNKLIRLSPTGIEYGDYAWNFASGCGNNIDGKCKSGGFKCWAYSISQRFEGHYPNGFKPTIYPNALLSPLYLKKPSRILCAFMGDLFWDCPEFDSGYCGEPRGQFGEDEHGLFTLKGRLFDTIEKGPRHTFLFLTKQPQNLQEFSPFPDNCWVGVTATDGIAYREAIHHLYRIEAKRKFISFEPLLQPAGVTDLGLGVLDWVIIGAQTKPTKLPEYEWVVEIVQACDKAGIPVFLKNNLNSCAISDYPALLDKQGNMRQETPEKWK